ncbi:Uncharacterized protein Fot_40594 [Forsythia ovata]|uniref:Uncharacterized protein n=1 Tax=Forsythia ovata TaxID=205694 RepID=A0ABD1SAS9_9LAMI
MAVHGENQTAREFFLTICQRSSACPQEVEANNCKILASRFDADFQGTVLELGIHAYEESEKEAEGLHENHKHQEIIYRRGLFICGSLFVCKVKTSLCTCQARECFCRSND